MSIIEKVQSIAPNFNVEDESFLKLKEALEDYHRMIEEGILAPRESNISGVYEQHFYLSNRVELM